MAFAPAPVTQIASKITPQYRHRKAAEFHQMAVQHHREAAAFYCSGDSRQADCQAQAAYEHAVSALEAGAQALKA